MVNREWCVWSDKYGKIDGGFRTRREARESLRYDKKASRWDSDYGRLSVRQTRKA